MPTESSERDVVDLLIEQHDRIRSLAEEVTEAEGEGKQHSFGELVQLMAVHESAEEQVLHPAGRKSVGDDIVDDLLRDEDDIKTQLAELYQLGTGDSFFDTQFGAVRQAILIHLEREERDEFPVLRRTSDPARLRRLAGAVRAAEAVAPSRPHPQAGVHPLPNLLAGPPVALFDAVRDAVGRWRRSNDD